jgi:hypothetical protein
MEKNIMKMGMMMMLDAPSALLDVFPSKLF